MPKMDETVRIPEKGEVRLKRTEPNSGRPQVMAKWIRDDRKEVYYFSVIDVDLWEVAYKRKGEPPFAVVEAMERTGYYVKNSYEPDINNYLVEYIQDIIEQSEWLRDEYFGNPVISALSTYVIESGNHAISLLLLRSKLTDDQYKYCVQRVLLGIADKNTGTVKIDITPKRLTLLLSAVAQDEGHVDAGISDGDMQTVLGVINNE